MADKLFRVKITSDNLYDVYSAAVIQCESREVLDNLIETKAFESTPNPNVDYSWGGFDIQSWQQHVESIVYIGDAVVPRAEGKIAAILCSDYVGA